MPHDTASIIPGARVAGVPVNQTNPNVRDAYEYGTFVAQSAGRYKTFQTPFSAKPIVAVTRLATAGSTNVYLMGTPSTGSFRARTDRAGSANVHYIAIGAR